MRYVMFMIPAAYGTQAADVAPSMEMIDAMMAYNAELADAGILEVVEGLHPPSRGVRLEFDGVEARPADVAAQGAVGGFWIINVESHEAAQAWASRCPALSGDVIELRRIEELDDLPQGATGDSE